MVTRGTKLFMKHLSTRQAKDGHANAKWGRANMPRVQITKFPGHECELLDSLTIFGQR